MESCLETEARSVRYGRFLAEWINFTIQTLPPSERIGYKSRFIDELQKYPSRQKKGEPKDSGNVNELKNIFSFDISKNPKYLAKLVKEGLHLLYQKDTSNRIKKTLLENL